ncbi:SGNH/GDSL hydrolase family protein [[Mycobacterium] crassicus]|uniref:SGNH/GDSL hydrolase family protein n=1 Tax=[Mycobacterium] crassicus TaxID=2872309 RepID=A0ABU5XG29_9MYCO|nr:SGNH/GDSL hydrolase family protein [Mycolicibacter sp. MYC098]MEB3021235.1 SGNH/GDSL hydrolase family protein [Mycolicibacter sp. MYC098]
MGIRLTRRSAVTLAAAGAFASSGTLYLGVRNLLAGQADRARKTIPKAWDLPPRADGVYVADDAEVQPFRRGANVDLHLMVFGDSTATGYGCRSAAEVPGALIANALARQTGKRVRLSTKALVGATSKGLAGQVDAMFVAGPPPDVAVIMIGANDVTALNGIAGSVQRLRAAVKRLRASGTVVIVGTCPKFGAISAIPRPLRWVAHARACQLARAQTQAVRAAGGVAVPFADFRAREFHDSPELLFAADQYHPSAAGYALAASQMIPALCAVLGEPDSPVMASSD